MTNEEVTKIRDDNWVWMKRIAGLSGSYVMTDSMGGAIMIVQCSGMDLRDYLDIQSKLSELGCGVMAEHIGELKSFVHDLTEEEIEKYQSLDEREQ